jgi:hypothetical protein
VRVDLHFYDIHRCPEKRKTKTKKQQQQDKQFCGAYKYRLEFYN